MLKTVRNLAIDNPWCLRLLMVLIAVVFVITMGWWGFEGSQGSGEAVAQVGGTEISWDQYIDAYEELRQQVREQMKEKLTDDVEKTLDLKKVALERLIRHRLWELAAREAGIRVSDEEVAGTIRSQPVFRAKDGGFDSQAYLTFLRSQRKAPAAFEEELRTSLMIERMQQMVRASIDVPDEEVAEAYERRAGRKSEVDIKKQKDVLALLARMEKQEKALAAYLGARRRLTPVTVHEGRMK